MFFRTTLCRPRRRDAWLAVVCGGAYVALGAAAVRDAGAWERRSFRKVNQVRGVMPVLRLPQQMGTPWVLPAMGLVGFWTHRPQLAVSATLALPLEKAMEVGVKKLSNRRRPAQAQRDARLRDDAPDSGPSYPSGHAGIAFAAVALAAPYLRPPVTGLLLCGATATTVTRVHQGAHYPLDAVGGALLGVAVGGTLNAVFGRP